jgi:hypothetical protein
LLSKTTSTLLTPTPCVGCWEASIIFFFFATSGQLAIEIK